MSHLYFISAVKNAQAINDSRACHFGEVFQGALHVAHLSDMTAGFSHLILLHSVDITCPLYPVVASSAHSLGGALIQGLMMLHSRG